jgi:5-methylcytosine-specific restriction endonuclease McrA
LPIRPENRSRYPADWKTISKRVRDEAGQRCEWCKVPNGATILRGSDNQDGVSLPAYRYADAPVYDHTLHAQTGEPIPGANWDTFDANARGPVKVVLTVAHLDHTPENCARDNLRALCQACHNAYDAPMRGRGIAERKRAKRAISDLFTKST